MTGSTPAVDAHKQGRNSDREDRDRLWHIARGDRESFNALYIDYHRRLSRFLLRLSDDYALAEEVINDTMFVVWQQAGEFRGASRVSTWIMGIAYRQAASTLRSLERRRNREQRAATEERALADPNPAGPSPDIDWLNTAMDRLPLEQRATIELAYYLGYSCAEIAQIQDCPVNTVKSRMHAARKRLRTILPKLELTQVRPRREQQSRD